MMNLTVFKSFFSFSMLFSLLVFSVKGQSPWVPGQGKGYVQASYTMIGSYGALFSSAGEDFKLNREVSDGTLQLFGEYGIGTNDAVLLVLPIKILSAGEERLDNPTLSPTLISSGNFTSVGNVEVAYKKNFIRKNFLFTGQLKVGLPTAALDEATGLSSGLDAISFTPSLSIGKGSSQYYGYFSFGSAIRTNDYSSDFRVDAELGVKATQKIWVSLVVNVVESFENGEVIEPLGQLQTGLYVNNQEYFAYGLKGIFEITENFGANLAAYGASSGNLVAKQATINFGVSYKW